MKVSCQACGAKYTIADDKVRGRKVKIRCKSCGTPIVVDGQSEAPVAALQGTPAAGAAPSAKDAGTSWSVNLSDTDQRTMTSDEIVAGWQSGVVTSDAFVWKDGMGDWVAILESPELAPLLSAGRAAPAAPEGTPFGPTIVTATESARLAGSVRGAGVDLFDASSGGPDEDEVATSAPALPTAGSTAYDDGKMTGARNENSVLFSLDSLKGGLAPEPKKSSAPARKTSPTAAVSSDPFAMSPAEVGGGNALFSLNTNQALLTAPAAPEPPPPRFDASGAPAAAPMNKALVYGGGGAAAVVLLSIGLLLGRSGGSESAAPEGSAKPVASAGEEPEKKSEPKEKEKTEDKPAETAAATASAAPSAAPTSTATSKVASTGSDKKPPSGTPAAPKEPKVAPPKPEEMPSQGTSPFSVSAAQVALTQAATNAGSCRKADGPTGSGKVQVTFATSGRVTTANVAGAPFGGTPVGGCVAGVFRKARVPAFTGNPVTVSKSFNIH